MSWLPLLRLPFQVFSHYFGPAQWLAGHPADAPGIPLTPFQIGRYQYQPNGEWHPLDWDGKHWIPGSGEPATGELREGLNSGRQRLLDGTEAQHKAISDAIQDAFPLTRDFGVPDSIPLGVNGCFRDARAWRQPVDPLMLDLDADGLELKRASGTILFDHNADAIRTGTGWIGADDGILVRDLNANGLIESGRELFGIDTLKSDGEHAVNGFDALSDLDTNADGNFTAADLAWNQVKVWRDLDQDGISDAGELFGLDQLGISRIGVVGSATNTTGGTQAGTTVNGSLIAQSASFTQSVNGTEVSRTIGAIDLEANNFYREFLVPVPLTEQAKALPQMQGSGRARNLAEAVSQNAELATQVTAFSIATTRDAQRALIDGLLTEWAEGSDFWKSLEDSLDGNITISGLPAGMTEAQYRNLVGVLEVFNGERFYSTGANGTTMTAGTVKTTTTDAITLVTRAGYGITPPAAQLTLLQQSYDALRESVYSALVLQTRLKPYLDSIELTIDENGIGFDTTALAAKLDAYKATNQREALIDLVELNRYALPTLQAVGFASLDMLRDWIDALPPGSSLRTELTALNVFADAAAAGSANGDMYLGDVNDNSFSAGAGNDALDGGLGNDVLEGGADNDTLSGGDGADSLYGQTGADVLTGGAGNDALFGAGHYGGGGLGDNDILDGGTGNDYLVGGMGSDTYLFRRGDGQDTINNDCDAWNGGADPDASKRDVLKFEEGVLASDVAVSRSGDNLIVKIDGTADQVTVQNYFVEDGFGARGWAVDQIRFADGTTWGLADIKTRVLAGNDGNNTLTGYATDDTLSGLAGNDYLEGRTGNDTLNGNEGDDCLDGGSGNDTLNGDDGADSLYGQTGVDVLTGGAGNDSLFGGGHYGGGGLGDNDTLDGGTGNDYLVGGMGSDTYLFRRGDGQDTINNDCDAWNGGADPDANKLDLLQFEEGLLASDVAVSRNGDNLVLKINGTTDQVTIQNYFIGDGVSSRGWAADQVKFADGTMWTLADIKTRVLAGGVADDTIYGYAGADNLSGGNGSDTMYGQDGNDTLDGGAGSDSLNGNAGNDTYAFGRGGGQDIASEYDTTSGNADVAVFGEDVSADQLWFRQAGNNLEVSIIGTDDKLTVSNWYSGSAYHLEQFKTSDGKMLLDSQVQNLVQAMASFSPPAAGQTTLPTDYQSSLNTVIAANWQ